MLEKNSKKNCSDYQNLSFNCFGRMKHQGKLRPIIFLFLTTISVSQSPSVIGPQGLILTPTAFKPNDGKIGFGYTYLQGDQVPVKGRQAAKENHLLFCNFTFLPKLNLTSTLTIVPDFEGHDGTNTLKDLAIFAQFHILNETKKRPSLAVGIYDFHSYSFYNALFMVASKSNRINNVLAIHTHFGYGVDWIDEHLGDTGPDRNLDVYHYLVGAFCGIDLSFKNLNLLMEYCSDEYNKTKLNFGIKAHIYKRSVLSLSCVDGKTYSIGFSTPFINLK